jgi:hypothetical protein
MLHLKVAQMNHDYTEAELKSALLNAISGKAFQHLRANQHLFDVPFETLQQSLADFYNLKGNQEVVRLQSLTQEPNETVQMFSARIINSTTTLQPIKPPSVRVAEHNGVPYPIDNPTIYIEMFAYNSKQEMLDQFRCAFFLQGLKPEVRRAMQAAEYTNLDDACKAAELAERHLGVTEIVNHVNALTLTEHTNYAGAQGFKVENYNPLAAMNARPMSPGRSQPQAGGMKERTRNCFRCGKLGHYARRCRVNLPGSQGNSREGSRDRKSKHDRSRSRDRKVSFNAAQLVNQLASLAIDGKYIKKDRGRDRSRSRSAHRDGSRDRRSRSEMRSRSRDRRTRSNSKNGR